MKEEKDIPPEAESLNPENEKELLSAAEPNGPADLNAKINELEGMVNQIKDQLLRKAAEFENYKKRVESDYASIVRYSNEELITRLLPVLDDFERSMKAIQRSTTESDTEGVGSSGTGDIGFLKGFELIYLKFKKFLEAHGVKHFEVVGKPFDPQIHDALMQTPNPGVPHHTVLEEVEKGYMLHDKVIRHARVIVSTESMETEEQTHANNNDTK